MKFVGFFLVLLVCLFLDEAQACVKAKRHLGCSMARPASISGRGCRPRLRFGLDLQSGRCTSYQYLGCGSNSKPFRTLDTCKQHCEGRCPLSS